MTHKRKPGPHLIIANRLTDGRVLFFGPDQTWVEEASGAEVADGQALAQLEKDALTDQDQNLVVSVEVVPADAAGAPAHIKQQMQMRGPSVRRDLGYQAGNA